MTKQVTKIEQQEVALPADPMVSMIERVAMDPNSDLAKLERMLELKERHDAQQSKALFAEAFARASADFPTIPLNGRGHNGKPYATLEDITRLTRPVLSAHGLALTFSVDVQDQVIVTAKLMHKAGHSEQTSMALPRDTSGSKNAVQAVGSTQKYGQRYTAQAILGLSLGEDDEDDGRASGGAETINADQFLKIRDTIEAIGLDESVVLNAEKITALEALPAKRFQGVMDNLKITAKQRGVSL
jgi:hypothetical protein